jgi:hypothetical protein
LSVRFPLALKGGEGGEAPSNKSEQGGGVGGLSLKPHHGQMTLFLAAFACRNRKRSNCKVLLCCGGPHDARLWPQENRKALYSKQKFSCATARAEALSLLPHHGQMLL